MWKLLERYEESITVATRSISGYDEFNSPVYDWVEKTVDGCLLAPQEPMELATGKWTAVRQYGHQSKYNLYIPKTCTIDFENARVKAGGVWWKVLGIPLPYPKVPIGCKWNQYVILERETG